MLLLLKKRGWGWVKRYRPPSEARSIPRLPESHTKKIFPIQKREKNMVKSEAPRSGADAIKKFTPSLGIPYLGV